jgi:hypothetical protein
MPRSWFARCVQGVEASGSARDPRAVCGAELARKRGGKKAKTMARKKHCYRSTKTGKPSKHGKYVTCHRRGKRHTRKRHAGR